MKERLDALHKDGHAFPVMEGMANYYDELQRQIAHPPDDDPIIRDLCIAQAELLEEGDVAFTKELVNFVGTRGVAGSDAYPDGALGASAAVGILRAAFQADQLMRAASESDFQFPHTYLANPSQETVIRQMKEQFRILSDAGVSLQYYSDEIARRIETYSFNILTRNSLTCLSARYMPVEMVMQVMRERFPNGVDWLDGGASIMQGGHRLAMKDIFPFRDLSIVPAPDENGRTNWESADSLLTQRALEILQRQSLLKHCVAIDLMDATNPDIQMWAKGCMRPRELADDEFTAQFDILANPDYEQMDVDIEFAQCDFTSPEDMARFQQQHPGRKFQLITYLTTLHQLPPQEVEAAIQLGSELLDPKGVMIVGDFVHTRGKKFSTFKNWHVPGHYQYYALDRLIDPNKWQKIARANGSRVTKLQLSAGKLMVGKSAHTMTELIRTV